MATGGEGVQVEIRGGGGGWASKVWRLGKQNEGCASQGLNVTVGILAAFMGSTLA